MLDNYSVLARSLKLSNKLEGQMNYYSAFFLHHYPKPNKLGEALTVHIQSPDKDEYGSDKFNKSNKNSNKNKNHNYNHNQQNHPNKQNQPNQSNRANNTNQVGNNHQSNQTKVTKEYRPDSRPDSIEQYEKIQF